MTSQSSQGVEYAFRCSSRSVENERRDNEALCLSRIVWTILDLPEPDGKP